MSRLYRINLAATAFTVAADLCELVPASNIPILIHGFRVWQTSDVGDAQDEQIGIAWVRGNTTSGSGGNTGVAAGPQDHRDAAASFTCETANTTQATAGTAITTYSTGWNVRGPLEVTFTPEQRIRADAGNTAICLRMLAAPADSLSIAISVDIEEL